MRIEIQKGVKETEAARKAFFKKQVKANENLIAEIMARKGLVFSKEDKKP